MQNDDRKVRSVLFFFPLFFKKVSEESPLAKSWFGGSLAAGDEEIFTCAHRHQYETYRHRMMGKCSKASDDERDVYFPCNINKLSIMFKCTNVTIDRVIE